MKRLIEHGIGSAVALFVAANAYRALRRRRREARFNRYMSDLHAQPADTATTLAHFWLGSLFTRYGTDEQVDDWYRLTHGWPDLTTTRGQS
jgi:TolA-binding protein